MQATLAGLLAALCLGLVCGEAPASGPYPASAPYPPAGAPYPPSAWRPSGALLVLPSRQQEAVAPPQQEYGPPPTEYGPPPSQEYGPPANASEVINT